MRHDKQRTSRGSSFKRIAKDVRTEAKAILKGFPKDAPARKIMASLARSLDAEAVRLRAMR